ncbi:MAG TPA: lysozyme [bacterium]|nr:lysozyme [bacterium]
MPTIGEQGLDLIRTFEQFRANPYQDAVGIWTIGYGAIRDLHGLPITTHTPPIDMDTANVLLQRDVRRASDAVTRLIRPPLNQQEFDALCSFTFNLGGGALQSSTLRQVINRNEEPEEDLFTRWDMAGGRHLRGLHRRRAAEYDLYVS